jgi:hypothetical protein
MTGSSDVWKNSLSIAVLEEAVHELETEGFVQYIERSMTVIIRGETNEQ